ncbi:MAG: TPM domain-containing protein [Thermoanaerobaculales bacterium]|jgi:uncharacterized protein|nr:TPM domain-containing protein [Thermoanaerobaculales bacterium]
MKRRMIVLVVLVGVVSTPCAALDVPPLDRRVTDLAGMLTSGAVEVLEADLAGLEADTGAQVAVLTVPSLEGEVLEDYSLRVVEAWKLGSEERDDGVLLLIARDDRKIRIEVGYGLEGVLPDARCGRIIDQIMKPSFRQGDFSEGTLRAVALIGGLIREDPEAASSLDHAPVPVPEAGAVIVMMLIFVAVIGTFAITALFSKGGGAWFLYLFLVPFFFAFPSGAFGIVVGTIVVVAWLVGFPILRALIWHTGLGRDFRTSHPGWVTWGSSGGSWGGRSSFGGGGFSGGGGSFGGGGASGGW